MTLDDVIDKIKKAYAAKFAAIKDSTNNVRNAVNKYEAAAQDDALNQFLIVYRLLPPDTEKKADDAALDLLLTVEKLPELQPTAVIELRDEEEDTEAEPASDVAAESVEEGKFPLLQKDERPILIFGGFAVEEKRKAIQKRSGVVVEWVSNERNGSGDADCENVRRRIRNGQYCGLIMLNELMSHRQSDLLIKAAKAAGIHHAVGKKGGTAALMSALELFEKQRKENET
jgi:hypothetical protein